MYLAASVAADTVVAGATPAPTMQVAADAAALGGREAAAGGGSFDAV